MWEYFQDIRRAKVKFEYRITRERISKETYPFLIDFVTLLRGSNFLGKAIQAGTNFFPQRGKGRGHVS